MTKLWERQQQEHQKPWTCITPLNTFLCRHWTAMAWDCLKRRFVEDVNTRLGTDMSFSFWTWSFCSRTQLQEISSLHLTNWATWNNRHEVYWRSVNALYKWHPAYCRRLRRVCLESLDFKRATAAEGSYIKSTRVISGFIAIIPNNGELNWSWILGDRVCLVS